MHDPNPGLKATKKAQSKPVALFVSDVHLQASMPRTTQAFLDFLKRHAVDAQQLYLLGDLFEYWAGDDDLGSSYTKQIVDALRTTGEAGVKIFWIAGNRDFLVGAEFALATGVTLLPDPTVETLCGRRIVLTHGDALCTDDYDYMAFRNQVRTPGWQTQFLAMPLAQRKAIIEGLRNGSREAQRGKSYDIMDVNAGATAALFDATVATVMIHGHTHRPACHEYSSDGQLRLRYVLPDWDCEANAARGGWLALNADGSITHFRFDGSSQTVS
ncbi:UDP-2,3-diacylglucosamine diphosphatase [Noviherbaspirillum autotrophicum]|uniref:UDP-2,3-diacylglucosamine hydrolase n=1 Tax=Noviherbaspirillum autotrophicum TaxID=709839 RepID=A0A0C2BLQ7_9BURK|nr:UDP-2,3-diacylglucosamine diphosphatase [Noviherbaspirillum autotrophicum]KIF82195.1 UDP-2,3-diacylglucosamine hydrolase [Noviherbaspirillum autotrophicum]